MTQVLEGFLVCKKPPQVGTVDNFTVEPKTSRAGKPYLRLKRQGPDFGGQPYTIIEAEQFTDYSDDHGNLGFNLKIQGNGQAPAAAAPSAPAPQAPQAAQGGNKDDQINRAVAFKGAVELAAAGKIQVEEVAAKTTEFFAVVTNTLVTPDPTPVAPVDPAGAIPVTPPQPTGPEPDFDADIPF